VIVREERSNELLGVLLLAASVIVGLSVVSYDPADLSYFVSTPNKPLSNIIGIIGAYLAAGLYFLAGTACYVLPLLTLFWAGALFLRHKVHKVALTFIGCAVLTASTSGLFSLFTQDHSTASFQNGGIIGFTLSNFMVRYFSYIGAYVFMGLLVVLSLLLATDLLVIPLIKNFFKMTFTLLKKSTKLFKWKKISFRTGRKKPVVPAATVPTSKKIEMARSAEVKKPVKPAPNVVPQAKVDVPKPQPKEDVSGRKPAPKAKPAKTKPKTEYILPSMDLLNSTPPIEERKIEGDTKVSSEILEGTLRDFGIEAKVVQVNQGPVITRYELQPATGVKINKITALSDDIALAMKAASIRIVAPVPGKGTVGVEVPNSESAMVYLKELLEADDYKDIDSKLKLALGKSISGNPVVTDLSDMPHLLIAGTTGSGKTVCVNCLIMSLLFNASPDELKFLMVDPKMVELAMFNGLPHMISPVVTEPKKVSSALSWVVTEMENRYKVFAEVGVRNIDAYNEKVKSGKIEGATDVMAYIVVIIDELADLMLVAQVDIESAITRLAQLSRAVGIHIVLATQRPSVDVITGVIKANFPARISFKVASKVDSRTVLDMNGADKLLGKGDMLFLEPGTEKPIRAQGGLVSDGEMEKVIEFIKAQRPPDYNEDIISVQKKKSHRTFEKDEVYDEAVRVVLASRQASVSMLQRKLGLGYTRAARLIDMMEEEGIVGPYQGSKPRDILIESKEEVEGHGNDR